MLAQLRLLRIYRFRHISRNRSSARGRVGDGGAQALEVVHVAVFVRWNTHVAERVSRGVTHAQHEHRHAVARVYWQHVIVEFARLARCVAQLVGEAGANVAQVFLGVWLVGSAQARINRLAQVNLAHVNARATLAQVLAHVFNVDHPQRGVFQSEFVTGRSGGNCS